MKLAIYFINIFYLDFIEFFFFHLYLIIHIHGSNQENLGKFKKWNFFKIFSGLNFSLVAVISFLYFVLVFLEST